MRRGPVVHGIVQATHAQRRTELTALPGMVVDHVEQYFDTSRMQGLDRTLELIAVAAVQVARLGSKVRERVVAPVIDEPALDEWPILHDRMYRQELDRGDAQALQVSDDVLVAQRRRATAHGVRNALMAHGQAAQVRLVND